MKTRKPIVAANWKMNKTPSETGAFLESFVKLVGEKSAVDIVVCPPFVSLPKGSEYLGNSVAIGLGAQNVSQHASGAYTGEVSLEMLKAVFVSYVILGHSERRALYGDTDALVAAIRVLCTSGMVQQKELVAVLKVSAALISSVHSRDLWQHVTTPADPELVAWLYDQILRNRT